LICCFFIIILPLVRTRTRSSCFSASRCLLTRAALDVENGRLVLGAARRRGSQRFSSCVALPPANAGGKPHIGKIRFILTINVIGVSHQRTTHVRCPHSAGEMATTSTSCDRVHCYSSINAFYLPGVTCCVRLCLLHLSLKEQMFERLHVGRNWR
jgi:hypothetical protein